MPFLVVVHTSLTVGMCCRALILADIGKISTVMLEASSQMELQKEDIGWGQ